MLGLKITGGNCCKGAKVMPPSALEKTSGEVALRIVLGRKRERPIEFDDPCYRLSLEERFLLPFFAKVHGLTIQKESTSRLRQLRLAKRRAKRKDID